MTAYVSLRPFYHFPGWVIETIDLSSETATVYLRIDERYNHLCPFCGTAMGENRCVWQSALDLPLSTANVVLIKYEAFQGYCSNCKVYHTFLPEGIDNKAQATSRVMHYVCRLCRFMPVNKIPFFLPISTGTARRWDKKILAEHLPDPDLDNLRVILIDEKSIGAHHQYVTVVINGENGEVLHLAEGKKKESLESFFEKLNDEQLDAIEAVGMDRSGAYKSIVSEYIPQAKIVFDKFHIVSNYHDAIDKVRRSEWNKAEEDNDKKFIKGQRYNLFKNPENLTDVQSASLNALLNLNKPLSEAYVLKDALKIVWTYVYPKCAEKYLDKWIGWAKETALSPLVQFAKGLDRDRHEILSFIRYRVTSAKLEAFNATIARIVRRACGYRDLEYLFLKIRQEANPVLQR